MEKLSVAEQTEFLKCSTERLICRLIKTGIAEKTVVVMDRQALLNVAADLKLNPVDATAEIIKPMAIWEQELELRRAELLAKEEDPRNGHWK